MVEPTRAGAHVIVPLGRIGGKSNTLMAWPGNIHTTMCMGGRLSNVLLICVVGVWAGGNPSC